MLPRSYMFELVMTIEFLLWKFPSLKGFGFFIFNETFTPLAESIQPITTPDNPQTRDCQNCRAELSNILGCWMRLHSTWCVLETELDSPMSVSVQDLRSRSEWLNLLQTEERIVLHHFNSFLYIICDEKVDAATCITAHMVIRRLIQAFLNFESNTSKFEKKQKVW